MAGRGAGAGAPAYPAAVLPNVRSRHLQSNRFDAFFQGLRDLDDYAEVWINGQMPRRSGYPSPATIQGLNMPNRVVLGTEVKAGDRFQLAVFAINGPMSDPFGSIWFRQAMVEFYR